MGRGKEGNYRPSAYEPIDIDVLASLDPEGDSPDIIISAMEDAGLFLPQNQKLRSDFIEELGSKIESSPQSTDHDFDMVGRYNTMLNELIRRNNELEFARLQAIQENELSADTLVSGTRPMDTEDLATSTTEAPTSQTISPVPQLDAELEEDLKKQLEAQKAAMLTQLMHADSQEGFKLAAEAIRDDIAGEERQSMYEKVLESAKDKAVRTEIDPKGGKIAVEGAEITYKPGKKGNVYEVAPGSMKSPIMIKCERSGAILVLGPPNGDVLDVTCSAGKESLCTFDLEFHRNKAALSVANTVEHSDVVSPPAGMLQSQNQAQQALGGVSASFTNVADRDTGALSTNSIPNNAQDQTRGNQRC